ncbi:MAG: hypothetical protein ACD_81C00141G0004 [uncultured bacterium]|uniref:Uncharacterized protein n=2 Tax=Candidatus Wolfeibacteriota TaxID=1752735 RepID=A0A0G1JGV0_9BACT|nr:MAG: hypothetical protein ACD_81C00141G0004 [uncultured bacterium]KKR12324.1 MAG: hypothetical protein UT41_C0002G0098 [Candidatus Wolfebacteria bacterium GW2011_GWC2_39_22]KKT43232.1 MAG: hypothetical protein UW32_C0002G0093 [Candidatus Wolfebacteria bacterium GW2011_GWE2_44_13]
MGRSQVLGPDKRGLFTYTGYPIPDTLYFEYGNRPSNIQGI